MFDIGNKDDGRKDSLEPDQRLRYGVGASDAESRLTRKSIKGRGNLKSAKKMTNNGKDPHSIAGPKTTSPKIPSKKAHQHQSRRHRERRIQQEESFLGDKDDSGDDEDSTMRPGATRVSGLRNNASDDEEEHYNATMTSFQEPSTPDDLASTTSIPILEANLVQDDEVDEVDVQNRIESGMKSYVQRTAVQATEVENEEIAKKRMRRQFLICSCLFCLLIAVVLGLALGIERDDDTLPPSGDASRIITTEPSASTTPSLPPSESPSGAPSGLPTTAPSPSPTRITDMVVAMLSEFIPSIPSTTIQQQAVDWVADNDSGLVRLQDSYGLLERFVLAVMYLAMNGNGWDDDTLWLSEAAVCGWRRILCDGETGKIQMIDLRKFKYLCWKFANL